MNGKRIVLNKGIIRQFLNSGIFVVIPQYYLFYMIRVLLLRIFIPEIRGFE